MGLTFCAVSGCPVIAGRLELGSDASSPLLSRGPFLRQLTE